MDSKTNTTAEETSMDRLGNTESIWRDAHSRGYIAEVRGLLNQHTGCHEWIRLGVFGTRTAAMAAILKTR